MIPLIAHCLGLVHLKVVVVPFPYHCAVFACKKAKKCIHFILFSTKNGLHLFKDFKRNSVGKYGTNACVAWACTFVVESTNEDNLVWEQRRWLSVKIRWHVQQQFVTSQNTTVVLLDAVFLPLIHCFKLTDAATFTLLLEPQKNRNCCEKRWRIGLRRDEKAKWYSHPRKGPADTCMKRSVCADTQCSTNRTVCTYAVHQVGSHVIYTNQQAWRKKPKCIYSVVKLIVAGPNWKR